MSLIPGTPVADALGNIGACSLATCDGGGGDLYGSLLQLHVQNSTGMNVGAEQGPGLRSTFNPKGAGLEQPAIPAAGQPDVRPDLVASQNMTLSNG